MHKYIDINKIYDFSKKKTFDDVISDIKKHKICNIDEDEESIYYISLELYNDYILQRANYESYIEEGMDARIMMELRKSAILPLEKSARENFYKSHQSCKTIEEIKNIRKSIICVANKDYEDLDWQLYYILKKLWGNKGKDLYLDFEGCFEDGEPNLTKGPDEYQQEFIEAHLKPIAYDEMRI